MTGCNTIVAIAGHLSEKNSNNAAKEYINVVCVSSRKWTGI